MPTPSKTTTSRTTRKPAAPKALTLTAEQKRVLATVPADGSPITAYGVCVDLNDVSTKGLEDINETLEKLQTKGLVDDESNSLFWHRTAKGLAA